MNRRDADDPRSPEAVLMRGIRSLIVMVLAVVVVGSVVLGAAVLSLRQVQEDQDRLNRLACSLARQSGLEPPPDCQPR